jgi:hypothetical protein
VRQRPIFFSLESEEALLPETFRYVGDNHFLYATDIPHWDTEFPENLQKIQKRQDLTDETKNKLCIKTPRLLVYENHPARDFEAGQVLAAEIDDLSFRRLLPGFQLDKNRDDFHI